jgi:hypothetical protein
MKPTSWVALVVLALLGALIVYSSLGQGGVRCEVCLEFRGRDVCRSVDGSNEHDARMAATTNACAFVASGVTDSMACERTSPRKAECAPR